MRNQCQIKDLWEYLARVMAVSASKLNLGGDEGGHMVFINGLNVKIFYLIL